MYYDIQLRFTFSFGFICSNKYRQYRRNFTSILPKYYPEKKSRKSYEMLVFLKHATPIENYFEIEFVHKNAMKMNILCTMNTVFLFFNSSKINHGTIENIQSILELEDYFV